MSGQWWFLRISKAHSIPVPEDSQSCNSASALPPCINLLTFPMLCVCTNNYSNNNHYHLHDQQLLLSLWLLGGIKYTFCNVADNAQFNSLALQNTSHHLHCLETQVSSSFPYRITNAEQRRTRGKFTPEDGLPSASTQQEINLLATPPCLLIICFHIKGLSML